VHFFRQSTGRGQTVDLTSGETLSLLHATEQRPPAMPASQTTKSAADRTTTTDSEPGAVAAPARRWRDRGLPVMATRRDVVGATQQSAPVRCHGAAYATTSPWLSPNAPHQRDEARERSGAGERHGDVARPTTPEAPPKSHHR
jgi:hypothetical protein